MHSKWFQKHDLVAAKAIIDSNRLSPPREAKRFPFQTLSSAPYLFDPWTPTPSTFPRSLKLQSLQNTLLHIGSSRIIRFALRLRPCNLHAGWLNCAPTPYAPCAQTWISPISSILERVLCASGCLLSRRRSGCAIPRHSW